MRKKEVTNDTPAKNYVLTKQNQIVRADLDFIAHTAMREGLSGDKYFEKLPAHISRQRSANVTCSSTSQTNVK
jgi:hypothetical protein